MCEPKYLQPSPLPSEQVPMRVFQFELNSNLTTLKSLLALRNKGRSFSLLLLGPWTRSRYSNWCASQISRGSAGTLRPIRLILSGERCSQLLTPRSSTPPLSVSPYRIMDTLLMLLNALCVCLRVSHYQSNCLFLACTVRATSCQGQNRTNTHLTMRLSAYLCWRFGSSSSHQTLTQTWHPLWPVTPFSPRGRSLSHTFSAAATDNTLENQCNCLWECVCVRVCVCLTLQLHGHQSRQPTRWNTWRVSKTETKRTRCPLVGIPNPGASSPLSLSSLLSLAAILLSSHAPAASSRSAGSHSVGMLLQIAFCLQVAASNSLWECVRVCAQFEKLFRIAANQTRELHGGGGREREREQEEGEEALGNVSK